MHLAVMHFGGQMTTIGAFIWDAAQMTFPGRLVGWTAVDYKGCCFIHFSANAFLLLLLFHHQKLSLCLLYEKPLTHIAIKVHHFLLCPFCCLIVHWQNSLTEIKVVQILLVKWLRGQIKDVTLLRNTNNTLWTTCVFLWRSLLRGQGECKRCLAVILLRDVVTVYKWCFLVGIDEHNHGEAVRSVCSPAAVTAGF